MADRGPQERGNDSDEVQVTEGPHVGGPSTGAGSTGGLPRPGLGRELTDDERADTVSGIGTAPVDEDVVAP